MWKGGPELHLMTPDPVDPVDLSRSGGSGDEFQTYDSVWEVFTKSALGGPTWSPFGDRPLKNLKKIDVFGSNPFKC